MDGYKLIKRKQTKREEKSHRERVAKCTHEFKLGYVKKLCSHCGEWISVPDPDLIKYQGEIGTADGLELKTLPHPTPLDIVKKYE